MNLIDSIKIRVKKHVYKILGKRILPDFVIVKKFLFIHIPKCAGTSFSDALYKEQIGHRKLYEYFIIDNQFSQRVFKFSICRHPVDRLISAYYFLKKGGMCQNDLEFSIKHLADVDSFEEFVLLKLRNKNILSYYHFTPQFDFITNDGHNIAVDKIYKLENLHDDIQEISEKVGFNVDLERLNKNNHKDKEKLTYEMKQVIEDVYHKDFNKLNYKII